MTKPEERCAWHKKKDKLVEAFYMFEPTFPLGEYHMAIAQQSLRMLFGLTFSCSCDFITLPKRSGSKSEVPTPFYIYWRKRLAKAAGIIAVNPATGMHNGESSIIWREDKFFLSEKEKFIRARDEHGAEL